MSLMESQISVLKFPLVTANSNYGNIFYNIVTNVILTKPMPT